MTDGDVLFLDLARKVIGLVLSAAADCNPPGDVLLRLEAIIRERDALKARPAREEACACVIRRSGTEHETDVSACPLHRRPCDIEPPSISDQWLADVQGRGIPIMDAVNEWVERHYGARSPALRPEEARRITVRLDEIVERTTMEPIRSTDVTWLDETMRALVARLAENKT